MATDVPRLAETNFAARISAPTKEARFWRRYKKPLLINEYAAVTGIHFCDNAPHDFLAASSTRVQIYSARTRHIARTISRFTDVVYTAEFRRDGKLVVACDASGLVQVFDAASRSILKTINAHKLPTHAATFSPHTLTTLATASDDKTVRVWDLGSSNAIHTFNGHEDYVRSVACMPNSAHLFVSGAYDNTVRVWDSRVQERGSEVARFSHDATVEKVLPIASSGATVASAGGLETRVWDLVAMSPIPLRSLQNHARGVSSLALNGTRTRLISGGLDGHLKIYDTQDYKVVHGVRYPSAVMSVAVSPDDRHLVVGMSTGALSIRTRSRKDESPESLPKKPPSSKSLTVQRFLRGNDYRPSTDQNQTIAASAIINPDDRTDNGKSLHPWDRALRRYAYADALDLVLPRDGGERQSSATVYAVLHDLKRRSGLRQALSDRDDVGLVGVLRWLCRSVRDPRMTELCVDVAMCILDIYGPALAASATTDALIHRLAHRTADVLQAANNAAKINGALTMIVHAAPAADARRVLDREAQQFDLLQDRQRAGE
ncbi:U3 small nucleolar RNA-associated protein 15 [Savitreella phatthalungensis]